LFDRNLFDYGLSKSFTINILYWTTGIGALLVLLNAYAARKSDNLKKYPQIRSDRWSKKLLFLSAIGWAGYIFSYELLFRGIFLSESVAAFGIVPAIVINIVLYAMVHIPKGLNETIGCIPFGIILCIITIHTGSIWVAFLTHTTLALSNEWFSIHYNSKMALI
jgi:membrane protease YdiL (CAAX protease family)